MTVPVNSAPLGAIAQDHHCTCRNTHLFIHPSLLSQGYPKQRLAQIQTRKYMDSISNKACAFVTEYYLRVHSYTTN